MRRMPKLCLWKCGRKTARICRICVQCCEARDRLYQDIDDGKAVYVPPDKRPGHRFYKRKVLSEAQKAVLKKMNAARWPKSVRQMPQD